jgi:hypothetical protein
LGVLAFLGCLLFVLPFGYMVGLVAAIVLSGGAVGQLPMLTIPLGILGSVVFALLPLVPVGQRFRIMSLGTAGLYLASIAGMWLAGHL